MAWYSFYVNGGTVFINAEDRKNVVALVCSTEEMHRGEDIFEALEKDLLKKAGMLEVNEDWA